LINQARSTFNAPASFDIVEALGVFRRSASIDAVWPHERFEISSSAAHERPRLSLAHRTRSAIVFMIQAMPDLA